MLKGSHLESIYSFLHHKFNILEYIGFWLLPLADFSFFLSLFQFCWIGLGPLTSYEMLDLWTNNTELLVKLSEYL